MRAFRIPHLPRWRIRPTCSRASAMAPELLIDGLALSAMPEVIEHEAARLRIAAIVHLPLAADVSLERETAAGLEEGERRALTAAALIIVTGSSHSRDVGPVRHRARQNRRGRAGDVACTDCARF